MTFIAALTGKFVGAFAVGLGVGVLLAVVVRFVRVLTNASD